MPPGDRDIQATALLCIRQHGESAAYYPAGAPTSCSSKARIPAPRRGGRSSRRSSDFRQWGRKGRFNERRGFCVATDCEPSRGSDRSCRWRYHWTRRRARSAVRHLKKTQARAAAGVSEGRSRSQGGKARYLGPAFPAVARLGLLACR